MRVNQMTKKTVEDQWLGIVLPAIYIVTVLTFDFLLPIGTVTPFFAVIGMLFMALKFRPAVMIPWTIIYVAIVCSIFLVPKFFVLLTGLHYYEQYVIPTIRAATYVVVGIASCYLCLALDRLRKSENELKQILQNLPWPILTSDHDGKLLYWNESAEDLIPLLKRKNELTNYFDLLAPPEFQGRTITEYLKRIDQDKHDEPLKLSVDGKPFKGHTQLIEWTNTKVLLTILSEADFLPLRNL